jgi:2Fe-2S ferredoxin
MPVIHVTNRAGQCHTIEGKVGATLMENLRDNDMDVEAICGGCCSCATCHVFVDEAWAAKLPRVSEDEQELISQTEAYQPGKSRLSCQIPYTAALDGITVTVAPPE